MNVDKSKAHAGSETEAANFENWSLVVAVNNEEVLRETLLKSPVIDAKCQVITKKNCASAGKAYNSALAAAQHEIIVFAHQDVYLPAPWIEDLKKSLRQLAARDPNWGVLGVVGVSRHKQIAGYCYSTGLGSVVGQPLAGPVEAESLDELLLVSRRSSRLRFDEQLPGFHFYGADICLESQKRGMKNYIVPAFCIHNSNGVRYFPFAFWRAYLYMRCKWRKQLPLMTSCTAITRFCRPLFEAWVKHVVAMIRGKRVHRRQHDVARLCESLQPIPPLQKPSSCDVTRHLRVLQHAGK